MAHLSGLCQGEVLRDCTDFSAYDILTLSEAFEQEDSAADVNADAIALLPVCCVDLLALQTEVAALISYCEAILSEAFIRFLGGMYLPVRPGLS